PPRNREERPRHQAVTSTLDLHMVGAERLRIRGCEREAPETAELLAWLRERREVVEEKHHEDLGLINVRYKGPPAGRGAFLRELRDRVFTLENPAASPHAVEIAHELEGRVRLRVAGLGDDDLVRLAAFLEARPGIHRASASPASFSILVLFDPAETGS